MLVMEKVEPPWFVLIRCDLTFFGQQHTIWQHGVLLFSALLVCLDIRCDLDFFGNNILFDNMVFMFFMLFWFVLIRYDLVFLTATPSLTTWCFCCFLLFCFVWIRCDLAFSWQQTLEYWYFPDPFVKAWFYMTWWQHPLWPHGVFVQNFFFRQEINILSLDWSTTGLLAQVAYFTNRIWIVIVKA